MKIDFDLIAPNKNNWELNINNFPEKTGSGDCGLFVEAENEKEAKEYFKNLIEIIKKGNFEE